MKSIVLVLTLVLASLSSTLALADSWRGNSYDRHRGSHYSNRYSNWRDYRTGWDNRYRYGSPYRGDYVSLSFGSSFGHSYAPYPSWRYGGHYRNRHDADSFIGGLVVGGLLTSTLTRDAYRAPRTVVHTRVVSAPRITTTRVVTSAAPSSRTRLLRDLRGNCFEISYAPDGTEQRAQLVDEACSF